VSIGSDELRSAASTHPLTAAGSEQSRFATMAMAEAVVAGFGAPMTMDCYHCLKPTTMVIVK